MTIERGSFITSFAKLAKSLDVSDKFIRNMLRRLETVGQITTIRTHRFTKITICKYDDYQYNPNEVGTLRARKNAQKGTNNDTNLGTQSGTNSKIALKNCYSNSCDTQNIVGGTQCDTYKGTSKGTNEGTQSGTTTIEDRRKEIYKENIIDGNTAYARVRDFENFENSEIRDNDPKTQNATNHSEVGGVARAGERVAVTDVAEWLRKNGGDQWREIACMQLGLTPQQLDLAFDEFQRELFAQGVEDKEERDIRPHFMSMIRKKIQANNKQKRYGQATNNGRIESIDDLREAVETGWRMGEAERNQRGA